MPIQKKSENNVFSFVGFHKPGITFFKIRNQFLEIKTKIN
jgi:hypothetical protein